MRKKIVKNTTLSDIEIKSLGLTVPASSQIEIATNDIFWLGSEDAYNEIQPLIVSGDIVINDGTNDLLPERALNYIGYADNFICKFTFYVDKNGSDTEGDGSAARPFLTLERTIEFITDNSIASSTTPVGIEVRAGVFEENPITLPPYVAIRGYGPRTRIKAINVNANLLTIPPNCTLRMISLEGVTNSSNWCINMSATGSGGSSLDDVFITNCSNGLKISSTSGLYTCTANSLLISNITNKCVEVSDNSRFTINSASMNGTGGSSVAFSQSSNGQFFIFNARATGFNKGVLVSGNSGKITFSSVAVTDTNISLDQQGMCKIELLGGNFDASTAIITDVTRLSGFFFNEFTSEEQLRVISELSVGLPGNGSESSFGGGGSYYNASLVYTYNGSTFTNVTSNSRNPLSGTFSIPGTAVNNALYISTAFPNSAGNRQPFSGIRAEITSAANWGAGEIIAEYWNGSTWVEFNHMSEAELSGSYLKYAKECFKRTGKEQIFFDNNILSSWQASDPVSLGINLYWMRWRVATAITTVPTFNTIKIHTDRTRVTTDGFTQYFGKGRVLKVVNGDINFEGTVNVPADQNIYLSDTLSVGKNQNKFFPAGLLSNSDLAGGVFLLPSDCDTSCKAVLNIKYYSDDTGTLRVYVDWSNSRDGDTLYKSRGAAPSNGARQQTVLVEDTYSVANRQRTLKVPLDISDFHPRSTGNVSDLIWVSLHISNTSTVDPMTIINLSLEYVANEAGGHF